MRPRLDYRDGLSVDLSATTFEKVVIQEQPLSPANPFTRVIIAARGFNAKYAPSRFAACLLSHCKHVCVRVYLRVQHLVFS